MSNTKISSKLQRQRRIRSKIKLNVDRPRLSIFRSNNTIYGQIIDDTKGKTLLGLSGKQAVKTKVTKTEAAKQLGVAIAKKALEKKIKEVVFDKGSYKYHGRIKALADGAREGGLKF